MLVKFEQSETDKKAIWLNPVHVIGVQEYIHTPDGDGAIVHTILESFHVKGTVQEAADKLADKPTDEDFEAAWERSRKRAKRYDAWLAAQERIEDQQESSHAGTPIEQVPGYPFFKQTS